MFRMTIMMLLAFAFTRVTYAHFVFLVPTPDGKALSITLSEDLEPDPDVDVKIIKRTRLHAFSPSTSPTEIKLVLGENQWRGDVPAENVRVIRGETDLGVMQREKSVPHWLRYFPKVILGDPFAAEVGDNGPVAFVVSGTPAAPRLRYLIDGRPAAKTKVTIIDPDGIQQEVSTNEDGDTDVLGKPGRYAAWGRHWLATPGTMDGKVFEQERRYATLVVDFKNAAAPKNAGAAALEPKMPIPMASFGAVSVGNAIYVYGGHIAATHAYDVKSVTGKFYRSSKGDGTGWEELPGGPTLQGMNLIAHGDFIYRVGGMQPRNQPGDPVENRSVTESARYNLVTGKWEALPNLPVGRSSHELAVIGDTLYVIGGWHMRGAEGNTWQDSYLTLDLSSAGAKWNEHAQPFERRALAMAALGHRIFVIGGLERDGSVSRRVDVLDGKTGTWSTTAGLPGEKKNGFAPAACVVDGRLFVSVADGSTVRFDEGENRWEQVFEGFPRLAHRMVAIGNDCVILGGAADGDNVDLIERFDSASGKSPATQPAPARDPRASGEQEFCPIMRSRRVSANSPTVSYRGVEIKLCCKTCLRRWDKDPGRFADPIVLPQIRAVSAAR